MNQFLFEVCQAYKAAALEAVREYFASSDGTEFTRRLEELGEPGLHNILVKLVPAHFVSPAAHLLSHRDDA